MHMRSAGSVQSAANVWHVSSRGEHHVHQLVSEFVAHCHAERNHQGLGDRLIAPVNDNAAIGGRVIRRQRLGGLLNQYLRAAA